MFENVSCIIFKKCSCVNKYKRCVKKCEIMSLSSRFESENTFCVKIYL